MRIQVEIKYKNGELENLHDGLARDFMEQYRIYESHYEYHTNRFIHFSYGEVKMYIKYDEIISVKVINE